MKCDEVDIGVGPWGWSSDERYDHSDGKTAPAQAEYPEWYVDQYGGMVRKDRVARFGVNLALVVG